MIGIDLFLLADPANQLERSVNLYLLFGSRPQWQLKPDGNIKREKSLV